ncbi:hypothetical protein [Deinococcus gobiensis]|uniref:Uncharacterized protein n=1 Tax=Deinococcus gobiensis (strain DSM 21396 / JCM 16679 / CGMCC 1.7299 / I-0) TaxID=745776 RepID=H8GWI9_DEIGI|nr:hypothetical protein [Deinococcus gobiensis]AFD24459.1 hypothetical protein DGo_CA0532 [Deinococcus gobiensis I-0]
MKRSLTLLLTALALGSGLADAARRSSGGGFGGSRSSGSSYRSSPTYRAPAPSYRTPTPPYTPPRNSSSGSSYTAPRSSTSSGSATPRSSSSAQRGAALPSNSSVRGSAANRAAAAQVTPTQLSGWKSAPLPAGVPRSALTYSATPSAGYQYQLSPGRYYPYPQSYYRQRNIGYDILKYALIFTAVGSVANALDGPDVVVNNINTSQTGGELSGLSYTQPAPARQGPNLWTYAGVGFAAAAAAWFLLGKRR